MKRNLKRGLLVLGVLAIVAIGVWYFLEPRTIATIEPGSISAFGMIDKIAPGNNIELYVKAKNPELFQSSVMGLRYIQPKEAYSLAYDPFGRFDTKGYSLDKIEPPIIYQPAPDAAKNWIAIVTGDNESWGTVDLLPTQEKPLPFKISIPEDAELPKNWYFYIETRDANATSFVQTRAECRVLVNMR